MTPKTHQPCPCGESSDAYTLYPDGHGYCHSGFCKSPYFKSKEEKMESGFHYEYLARKGISAGTHEFFSCRTKVSETGEPYSVEYPYPSGWLKHRTIAEKEFRTTGKVKPGCIGTDKFAAGSAPAITIVEGEDDMMSVFEMMGKYPVISVRSAVTAIADCREDYEYIMSFPKIYLALDNDAAGEKATSEIANIFGFQKVYHVPLHPYKDANDFLRAGKVKEFRNVWFNSGRYLPKGIVSSLSSIQDILSKASKTPSVPTPYPSLNWKLGGGLRMGKALLVSGLTGIGKTEFLREIEYSLLKQSPENRIGILHFEEGVDETVKRFVGKELRTPAHMDEAGIPDGQVLSVYEGLVGDPDRVHYVMHYGSEEPGEILRKIRFLVAACGCQYIFLDNITVLGTGRIQDDERKELDYLSTQLEMLVKELQFCLVYISHENETEGTRGSQNINKVCDVWLNIKRDVKTENDHERNIQVLTLFKNRQAGRTGPVCRLIYDEATTHLSEVSEELPT